MPKAVHYNSSLPGTLRIRRFIHALFSLDKIVFEQRFQDMQKLLKSKVILISPSQFLADTLTKISGLALSIKVIRNGTLQFSSKKRHRPLQDPVIGYMGTVGKTKGLP